VARNLDVTTWIAGPSDRRSMLIVVAGFALVAAAIAPIANRPMPTSYPLYAMILAASFLCFSYTGLLLVFHARSSESIAMIVLAAGFFFAGATMIPHAATFPGMFAPADRLTLGSTPATVGLLWLTWRAGLLISMLAYCWFARAGNNDPASQRQARWFVLGLTGGFVLITAIALWLPGLPPMVAAGRWSPFFLDVLAPVVIGLTVAVMASVGRSLSRATVLDLCLAIVAFAILMDAIVMILGERDFTVGWYASRAMSLAASTVVLGVLLRRESQMYAALVVRAEILEGEAHTDTLTGLPNRRRFDEEFARIFGSSVRRGGRLAVAIADIDRFKRYNDAFGHQAGDEALHAIAQAIGTSVDRSGDLAARYGGEEFVVLLEDSELDGAVAVAERIRGAVLAAGIRAPHGGPLSVSVGVAVRYAGDTQDDLLRHADEALYRAKERGRNRVVAWKPAVAKLPVNG
jgi:diguanylate cyclase (GGDEF)-like protein